MNKQELIAKIAKDTGLTKIERGGRRRLAHRRRHEVAQEGRLDHVRRVRHVQDVAAQGAHGAQPADRRRRSRSRSAASSASRAGKALKTAVK